MATLLALSGACRYIATKFNADRQKIEGVGDSRSVVIIKRYPITRDYHRRLRREIEANKGDIADDDLGEKLSTHAAL